MNGQLNMEVFILRHLERRPLMEAIDVYKLLYQAVFGVGHILGENALDRLQEEVKGLKLDTQPEEPLTEDVSPDGTTIRVNLRPFIKEGLYLNSLYLAMKSSRTDGDTANLLRYWEAFTELVNSGKVKLDKDQVQAVTNRIGPANCPTLHHSEAYRRAYAPSYRVVQRKAFEDMFRQAEA